MNSTLPAQVYGKDRNRARAPFEELAIAPGMKDWAKRIPRLFSFQWMAVGPEKLPDVWYLYPLPDSPGQALLSRFEDVGNDPRPHTLRRTVALCAAEQEPLLAAICRGDVRDVSPALESDGNWVLEYEEGTTQQPVEWKAQYLQAGLPGSYELLVEGIRPPAPAAAPATTPPATTPPATTPPATTPPDSPISAGDAKPLPPPEPPAPPPPPTRTRRLHLAWAGCCTLLTLVIACLACANMSLRRAWEEAESRLRSTGADTRHLQQNLEDLRSMAAHERETHRATQTKLAQRESSYKALVSEQAREKEAHARTQQELARIMDENEKLRDALNKALKENDAPKKSNGINWRLPIKRD